MTTLLLTGFGPFFGAPYNPTGPLVHRLVRIRRPSLADVTLVAHVFATRYGAVEHELPKLIARHKPDALLMFGLAPRTKRLRVETRACNALALLPDAGGQFTHRLKIAPGGPSSRALPAPARRLLAALHEAHVLAELSHDAGHYLCNYLIWNAAEATTKPSGPRLATFIHVPNIRRGPRRKTEKPRLSQDDLVRAGTRLMVALATAARR